MHNGKIHWLVWLGRSRYDAELSQETGHKISHVARVERTSFPSLPHKTMLFTIHLGIFYGCSHQELSEDTSTVLQDEEPCFIDYTPYPFIDEVVSIEYGEGAGFGQENYPDIVYGPPKGGGELSGSLDVLTIGEGGSIVFSFRDVDIINEDGADLIIFENPFVGWTEPAIAAASIDGIEWVEWPCDENTWAGCVGIEPVFSHLNNCIDARDPENAGGDALDLSDIGMESARYIKITDAGISGLGGFDLDAAAVLHTKPQ